MARGKAAHHPAPIEPEEESQEMPEDESEVEEVAAGPAKGKITKSYAVRVALAEGYENPTQAVAFIRKRFGIEMVAQHFSSIKSQEKKKTDAPAASEVPKAARRKPAATKPEPVARPPATPPTGEMDFMDDLTSVKALVRKLGAEQVKKIVDLFE